MLRIIETFNNLPEQFNVDEKSDYHPGKFGSISKGKVVISDGFNNLGIIDDIKTSKLRYISNNDIFDSDAINSDNSLPINKKVISAQCILLSKEIDNINWNQLSELVENKKIYFLKSYIKNGKVYLKEDRCKFSQLVGHNYKIHILYSILLDSKITTNSTVGSNKCTVWTKNLIVQTDMWEIDQLSNLKKYKQLFVRKGLVTPERWNDSLKSVGFVLDYDSKSNFITYYKFAQNSMDNYLW